MRQMYWLAGVGVKPMDYYISDLHFGHKNVIKFDGRPYSDVREMDRILIENWNYRVRPEDTVYILGDVCYRSEYDASWYLKRLNGHKFLILGNHDLSILSSDAALAELEGVEKMLHVSDEGRQIQLCHFPLADWNGMHHGSRRVLFVP